MKASTQITIAIGVVVALGAAYILVSSYADKKKQGITDQLFGSLGGFLSKSQGLFSKWFGQEGSNT